MEHQVVSIWVHFIKNTCILFLSHIIYLDFNDLQKLSLIQRDSEAFSEDEGKEAMYMTYPDSWYVCAWKELIQDVQFLQCLKLALVCKIFIN